MGEQSEGVSRRRMLVAGVWTMPVVLIATSTPARAASTTGPITIVVNPTANLDEIDAHVEIPDGMVLTDIYVTISWHSQASGSSVEISPPSLGWVPSDSSTDEPAIFFCPGPVSESGTIVITIIKGQQVTGSNNDFSISISAHDQSSGQDVSASVSGDYAT